ncbi:M20 family metallopeptidase [Hoeflea sp.]|uniref:M20 family metallopeptidase n=1 Tax=Hoeflea sp. TaxID=1940281 RepID=UPI0037480464
MNTHPLWDYVEASRERFKTLSDRVWATPETCYMEQESVAAHIEELTFQGFRVQQDLAGIPTAVMGEAGSGGPVIAFLGEFDALAGLSQKADVFEKDPLVPGANGHGCGHNLLGSAAMLAATAVKNWLKETGTPGTVRYYGCPAEEGGAAKAFMVRAGAFSDVDIAITWHPGDIPAVAKGSSLANARVDFTFEGRASHAADSPHLGRSALDAVELMSVGINYMREHMPDEARIHYAIMDGGGISPNVVQAYAKVRYVVRAATTPEMLKLLERVRKVADGAALMTETQVSSQVLTAVSNLVYNAPLGEVMQRNLEQLGPPSFSEEDKAYAARFQATLSEDDIRQSYRGQGLVEATRTVLADFIVPADTPAVPFGGSTDVADVSWVVPTVQMWGANHAIGTQLHTWQVVAQGKGEPAIKGMVHAAAIMAATAADAFLDPELLARAKADLARRVGPEGYVSPLPEDAEPPISEMG